ncbi:electron transport complex subunit RsxC [Acetobacterium tundrae]|uniref:Ion-translocating oxidoreductase complex subunit C n=1 Tax=Acetobacterium tundrae TaxID=132932 RepID=A0ABR6WIK7_9FIRM|nr:electron transport complex subunit RsxC [Acetobacterium tundrae]MBC3796323.1 electron transport complex subunit RsxC [Acetobacterium tundrae]
MMKSFRGGVHPNDRKSYTANKPIETAPLPNKAIIPVRQHIGAPCSPIVAKGDLVKKGQLIATTDAFVSGNVHASISGKVIDVGEYPHPGLGTCLAIVIENDGQDEWAEGIPLKRDWQSLDADSINKIIREAGIVGMGGATFPTHVKMTVPKDKTAEAFILNAAECEPYLTADHRLMLEESARIVTGVKIAMKALGVTKGYVGIEDNKPDAIEVMKKAFEGTGVEVMGLPTKYPQGAEKMLIKVITGKEVPSGGLPMDVGVVVQNVGTAIAISDAVTQGIPLIQRVTTISGKAIKEPKNILVRVGTTFREAIDFCGGFASTPEKILSGGPMMGMAEPHIDLPIIKGVSGILALAEGESNTGKQSPCIRCGRCLNACPMGLNPSMFSLLGEKNLFEEAVEDFSLLDCVECGSCVYACPAKRNIVQYVKYSKAQNAAKKAAKK